jgi:hypothetical protein
LAAAAGAGAGLATVGAPVYAMHPGESARTLRHLSSTLLSAPDYPGVLFAPGFAPQQQVQLQVCSLLGSALSSSNGGLTGGSASVGGCAVRTAEAAAAAGQAASWPAATTAAAAATIPWRGCFDAAGRSSASGTR